MQEPEIIGRIAQQSGKKSDEIRALIVEKKRKFSGLLTDSGAAFMVAKDLGIEPGLESMKRLSVSQLRDGMQNVDLLVKAVQVSSPKEFEKNGRRGKLCNLVVADSTGEIRLTVWHDEAEKVQGHVRRGTILLLRNCFVKSFNDRPQLSLGYKGSIELNPKTELFAELPAIERNFMKISSLLPGMNDVSVLGRITRVFPATEFENRQRKGRVMNFVLGDETGTVRAAAWNDVVESVGEIGENKVVEIDGAYTKEGLRGTELHLGWQARISEKDETGMPSASEIARKGAEKAKIVDLKEGSSNVLLAGKIVAVNPGRFFYEVCPKCQGKLQRLEEGILCDKCGEVKEPGIRPVVSVRIDDGSAQISVAAYGKEAEKIFGFGKEELKKRLDNAGREKLLEELQRLAGRKIEAVGKAKVNSFSQELEFGARSVEMK